MTMRYQKNEDGTVTTVEDTKYNGWANYETWNVALYINNESGLYFAAREFMLGTWKDAREPYLGFVRWMGMANERTADNIRYVSRKLDYAELNEMMRELVS